MKFKKIYKIQNSLLNRLYSLKGTFFKVLLKCLKTWFLCFPCELAVAVHGPAGSVEHNVSNSSLVDLGI
jgi:hypothetical protein